MQAPSGTCGRDKAASYLFHALEAGQLTHAYLLAGATAATRRELARRFAAAVLAAADDEGAAAGELAGEIAEGGHPDLRELSPAGAGAYLVEQVREVVADAALAPIRAKRKVYIFDDAECLAGPAANALLKTLEEPPADVVCVLLARTPGALLPTLRSRCVVLGMAFEEERCAEDTVLFELLFSLAMRADNRAVLAGAKAMVASADAGDGELEKRHNEEADAYADYLTAGARKAMAERHKREERSAKRGGLDAQLALARSWLRDCLLVQQGADALVRHAWCVQRTAQVAGRTSPSGVLAAIEAVNTCEHRIHYNVTPQLACEAMLFEIRRALCR